MAGVHELMVGCNEMGSSNRLGPGHIKLCLKKKSFVSYGKEELGFYQRTLRNYWSALNLGKR